MKKLEMKEEMKAIQVEEMKKEMVEVEMKVIQVEMKVIQVEEMKVERNNLRNKIRSLLSSNLQLSFN